MQTYHFDIEDGQITRDEDGEQFATIGGARTRAVAIMAEVLNDEVRDLIPEGRLSVQVRCDGREVFSVLTTTAIVDRPARN